MSKPAPHAYLLPMTLDGGQRKRLAATLEAARAWIVLGDPEQEHPGAQRAIRRLERWSKKVGG